MVPLSRNLQNGLFSHTWSHIASFCSPRRPTFKGATSLLSAVTAPRLGNTCIIQRGRHFLGITRIAQEVASHFLDNTLIAQEVASLYGKYRDTSAMAVASLQHGSFGVTAQKELVKVRYPA